MSQFEKHEDLLKAVVADAPALTRSAMMISTACFYVASDRNETVESMLADVDQDQISDEPATDCRGGVRGSAAAVRFFDGMPRVQLPFCGVVAPL